MTDHRCESAVKEEDIEGAIGMCDAEGPRVEVDGRLGVSYSDSQYNDRGPAMLAYWLTKDNWEIKSWHVDVQEQIL